MHLFDAAHSGFGLAAWCGADPVAFGGIALGLFTAALVGGFAHCAPMCGPFVLMQIARGGGDGPRLHRLVDGALPLYHLGRLTTYVALGAAAGSLGASLLSLMPFRWAAVALLTFAAYSFLLQGLGGLARWWRPLGAAWLAGPLARLTRQLLQPERGVASYRLGLVLGLLPCGFLYSALFAAAATGGTLAGGLAMAGFALGTVPALAAVGLLGAGVLQRWRGAAAALAAPILLLNAVTLGGLALRLAA